VNDYKLLLPSYCRYKYAYTLAQVKHKKPNLCPFMPLNINGLASADQNDSWGSHALHIWRIRRSSIYRGALYSVCTVCYALFMRVENSCAILHHE
jgi:hypothetical protein